MALKYLFKIMAVAVYAAAAVGMFLSFGCDDQITPPPEDPEFGTAELIYTLDSEVIYGAGLVDVSADGSTYVLKSYDENTKERSLWILDVPDGEPRLIASDPYHWWGYATLSPDKENVVFANGDGIYVIPVAGGEARLVYGNVIFAGAFQWLDNETVLLLTLEDRWYVKTVNINTYQTGFDLPIYSDYGHSVNSPYLSPDGSELFVAIIERREDFGPEYYYGRIYDTDTWDYVQYELPSAVNGPWSPDATKVSFNNLSVGEFYKVFRR
jgi:Tol biopolymer transport system component